jgi:hypothetical protein
MCDFLNDVLQLSRNPARSFKGPMDDTGQKMTVDESEQKE